MGGPRINAEPDGWKGGNTWKGEHRKGYRGGRKSVYPEGTVMHAVAMKLSDAEYAMAIWIGGGNASQGIRRALEIVYQQNPVPGLEALDRYAMEKKVKADKAAKKGAARLARLMLNKQEPISDPVGAIPSLEWDDV